MRYYFFCIVSFLGSILFALEEKPIVVVTAGYNNAQWYKRNLDSIFMQDYSNYKLFYTDDCSSDGTGQLVANYIEQKGMEHKVELVCNAERKGALENQYHMIHACDDDAIIIIVDGDDWLPHKDVLSYINKKYSERDIWLTYGQFREWPSGGIGFNRPIPSRVIKKNTLRDHYNAFSHLRTYYAWLFKKVKIEDLMQDGTLLSMSGDIAVMLPMAEMARDHFAFIPIVLYIYNGANVINDHKVSKEKQRYIDLWVRSRPSYTALRSKNDEARYESKNDKYRKVKKGFFDFKLVNNWLW